MSLPLLTGLPRRIHQYIKWARARIDRAPPRNSRAPSVTLPLNLKPFAAAYVYNAYSLGILTVHEPAFRFYPACIQLYFPHRKLTTDPAAKFEMFPPLGLRQYAQLGHLASESWDTRTLPPAERRSMGGRLIGALARGRYLYAFLDEFYVPGSQPHLRYNHRHERLLFGYDAATHAFLAAGYSGAGEYGITRLPVHLCVAAMLSREGRKPGGYSDNDTVVEIAPVTPVLAEAGPAAVVRRCVAYMNGVDDERSAVRQLVKPAGEQFSQQLEDRRWDDGAFGIRTYPLLARYFAEWPHRRGPLDLRMTRVLWEHKALVRETVQEMDRRFGLKLWPALGATCDALVLAARHLHHLIFAADRGQSDLAKEIDHVVQLLGELEEGDRRVFSGIIRAVESARLAQR